MNKKRKVICSGIIVIIILIGAIAVYEVGMIFEFEYPFAPTLYGVKKSHSYNGQLVNDLIKEKFPGSNPDWHTCHYCFHLSGYEPKIIRVRLMLDSPEKKEYWFVYSKKFREIVPADTITANMFPELVPPYEMITELGRGTGILVPKHWLKS